MPVSDKKKCQTLINRMADVAEAGRAGVAELKAVRDEYVNQSVDPTGTPLDGNVAAVNDWITRLDALMSEAVPTGMLAARVPSHTGNALEAD